MDSQTTNRCEHCPSQVDCANLYTALQLIRKADLSGALLNELLELEAKLSQLEYSFPESKQQCPLSSDNSTTRTLIAQAIGLIKKIHSNEPSAPEQVV